MVLVGAGLYLFWCGYFYMDELWLRVSLLAAGTLFLWFGCRYVRESRGGPSVCREKKKAKRS